MQHEIVEKGRLLNWFGNLLEVGYSKSMLRDYYREDIKAPKYRIKEWDYYLIYNDDYGVALTVADNGYMGMLSASVLRFANKTEKTTSQMTFMPLGKFNMPRSSREGDVLFKNDKVVASFKHVKGGREIEFSMLDFEDGKKLEVKFTLSDEPKESIVVHTPFKKKKHFYYNQKIIGFNASGYAKVGDETIKFNKKNTEALLDWGRGVWTYKNTWYWGAASTILGGKKIGFNIGYGFGNTEKASENIILYDGKVNKLDEIYIEIPKIKNKEDFMSPWKITSNDGRFEMNFTPVLNRKAFINALVLCSNQNQVFGKFTGYMILDDGKKIFVEDMFGFVEKVFNKW